MRIKKLIRQTGIKKRDSVCVQAKRKIKGRKRETEISKLDKSQYNSKKGSQSGVWKYAKAEQFERFFFKKKKGRKVWVIGQKLSLRASNPKATKIRAWDYGEEGYRKTLRMWVGDDRGGIDLEEKRIRYYMRGGDWQV